MSKHRDTGRIDMIVIHCSDTPNGRHFTAEQIDEWHAARHFERDPELSKFSPLKHIGYHLVNYVNGAVCAGRRYDETGAHAVFHEGNYPIRSNINARSIGICMIGTDQFAPAQWRTLRTQVESLKKAYPAIKHVVGHCDVDTRKTCPCFSVAQWLERGMRPMNEWVVHVANEAKPA